MRMTTASRRDFLRIVGGAAAGLALGQARAAAEPAPAPRPNIIVIVSDDQGYADVGVHGCKDVPTPNLDTLAAEGVRCSSGYVSCPVCSPTRAGLITGRYQQRFQHEYNPGPTGTQGLTLKETALPELLRRAGYATGMVGKWHLGTLPEHHPLKRGFQEFYGFLGGAHPYLNLSARDQRPILRGTTPVDEKEYLTDAFGREAVAFIQRHAKEPFFLYLTFNAVHAPVQAPESYTSRVQGIAETRRRTYAAMLTALDANVGKVLAALAAEKLEERTLVFFNSDNGGPLTNGSRNTPLRGTKGTVWEGGVRVPFFARWKGVLPAGKVYAQPVSTLDIVPTAVAAGGAALEAGTKYDGVDLLPYLKGENAGVPHAALFWRFGPEQKAVRAGRYKLARVRGQTALFDLDADMAETKDLAAEKPDKVKELGALLEAWEKEVGPPPARPAQAARAGQKTAGTAKKAAGAGKKKAGKDSEKK